MYDGDGQRVQKIACPGSTVPCTAAVSGAQVTTFAYDAAGNLAGEYTSTPAAAPSGCGTATCYVTVDQIGSTRMVTDSNGNVVRRYDFLPFGEELWAGVGGRTNAQGYQSGQDYFNPKFTGQYRDVESRLDYFNARYYSPEQGRFLSPDPGNAGADPGDPQTWNGYAYVGNNPLSYTDPSGMCETCIGAATGNPILIGIGAVIDLGLLLDGIFGGGGPSTIPPALATPSGPVLGPASDDIWNEQIPGQGSGSITTGGVFGSGNTSPFVFSLEALGGQTTFSVDAFAKFLNCNAAGSVSTGFCVIYVRKALAAAGMKTAGHPELPKNYGPFLAGQGCKLVSPTPAPDYAPKKGDIAVLQPVPGRTSQSGHIEGWDGSQWISDFRQGAKDVYPGSVYRNAKVPYAIYRCN